MALRGNIVMGLEKFYRTMAAQVIESLRDECLDLDRFVPALHEEMRSLVNDINKHPEDWEIEHLNWAANQEREAKLFLEGITDAINELSVVTRYGEASTDHIDMDHIKAAAAKLQNLKRRMES